MKRTIALLACATLFFTACNNNSASNNNNADSTTNASVNPANDWNLGVALWTFHTVSFSQSLNMVDSAGLKYIEPNTFHNAGTELKDSAILKLSPSGIDTIKSMIARHELICQSIYIVGDSTIASWKKQ